MTLRFQMNLEKIYYGENPAFDVHGKLFSNSEFVEFKWNLKHEKLDDQLLIKTHMFGHYNFINLLCAACIGNYFSCMVAVWYIFIYTFNMERGIQVQ